jgi:SAM-dependent methyltransferase
MAEFWEEAFKDKQEMWGIEAAKSAKISKDFFVEKELKNILIPGFGYGRNAKPFLDVGMTVTGIEISQTAIDLGLKHFGNEMKIYHGSVTEMPFDSIKYDGIFCYGLIHLLDENERRKLIQNCYNQLTESGFMVFTAVSKNAPMYGKGTFISENRYEIHKGAKIYFYDEATIEKDFAAYGLFEISEIEENQLMFLVKCEKK